MTNTKKQTLHVISATHWDREWIIPFEGYLPKFVNYTDKLIYLMESDPEFKYYHMDGQSICIEDYLTVRPENSPKIYDLVKNENLLIGPWYTLPDMNLTCGEAIVRNLQFGIKTANSLGGAMMEGYTACSNGQISQLPQIYTGFGINSAIIYKGIHQDRLPREFLWRSPDGSEIITLHLSARYGRGGFYALLFHEVICNVIHDDPRNDSWSYDIKEGHMPFRVGGQQFHNPSDYDCLNKQEAFYPEYLEPYLKKLRKLESHETLSSQLITFHGMDHTPPYASTPRLIAAADKCFDDLEVIDSSLPKAMKALKDDIAGKKLVIHEGELRDTRVNETDRNANIASLSARMDIKILNRRSEHILIDQAEPLCVWKWLTDGQFPDQLMSKAWRKLLSNHGHDSIDGCSMDKVSNDVIGRYNDCIALCEAMTQEALGTIIKSNMINGKSTSHLAVFNSSLTSRTKICEMMIDLPGDRIGSDIVLIGKDKQRIIPQIKSKEKLDVLIHGTIMRPMQCTRYHVLFEAANVPSMGWVNFKIEEIANSPVNTCISPSENILENNNIRVSILKDGRLNILCKTTGHEQRGVHYFLDCGDIGNPWNFTPEGKTVSSVGMPAEITMLENGYLRAVYQIKTTLQIPASRLKADKLLSKQSRKLIIVSEISLEHSSKHVNIKTTIKNASRYHKLVACFPTGINCEKTYSGGQYDVAGRSIKLPDMSNWKEAINGYPNYGFAGLSDGKYGVSILNIGLPEYFVEEGEKENIITLTLLRATQLKDGWPEGHDSVKNGHCLGEITCNYAIYPHAGGWQDADLLSVYNNFAVPLLCTQYFGAPLAEQTKSLINLESKSLQLSCIKKAEDGNSIIIRLWNPLNDEQASSIIAAFPISKASYVDFNENLLDNQIIHLEKTDKHTVKFRVAKKKIITLRLEFKRN